MRVNRKWRIIIQSATLLGFLWLFLQTEYRGTDELAYPVSLLFRLDRTWSLGLPRGRNQTVGPAPGASQGPSPMSPRIRRA